MKGKVKKNQLIIVALAVMIAAAGYLNYTGRLFGENAKGTKEANADLTNQELLWLHRRRSQENRCVPRIKKHCSRS